MGLTHSTHREPWEIEQGTSDSRKRPGLGPPKPLCSICDNLNLEEMLCVEKNERPMGHLSDYSDPDCPFCGLISQSICLAWGAGWSSARLCSSTKSPPELFMQSRSILTVKENGRTAYPQPCLLVAIDRKPPNFGRNRAPVREVDRVNDRYIIAEIESLPGDSVPKDVCSFLRREVGGHVNIQLVKHWLEECRKHQHYQATKERHADGLFSHEHPFRLIDVIDECLVQRVETCDYVALSYVWGQRPTILAPGDNAEVAPILLTTKKNKKSLSLRKSLSQMRKASSSSGRIPRTVRDAMEFTRKIGMRYLWVDTLCIVQNDRKDMTRLIERMDDVYNNAALTIIAAAGSDADAGLRGISPRTGYPITPARIVDSSDGRKLNLSLRLPSLCEEVRGSTWHTRGWAFQEQTLSRRCLYFTAEETFFHCAEVQWREGYVCGETRRENLHVQVRTGPPWWNPKLKRDLDPTPYYYLGGADQHLDVQDYQRAVQDYSRKNLTFSHDVLNAFGAIFNRFERLGNTPKLSIRQAQGIPAHFLFQALLWFPSDGSQRRTCGPNQLKGSMERFSTWSWASWIGPVDFIFADSLWLSRTISKAPTKHIPMYVPIICWHYGDTSQRSWSHNTWTAAEKPVKGMAKGESLQFSKAKDYLKHRIGIDIDLILDQSLSKVPPSLRCGELGFLGAYLPTNEFCLSDTKGQRVGSLQVSAHHGEFRFDSHVKRVDELVSIVASDTLTKPAITQSTLLGLITRNGVSRRVGIGYIYCSKEPSAAKPKWQYRFFKVQ